LSIGLDYSIFRIDVLLCTAFIAGGAGATIGSSPTDSGDPMPASFADIAFTPAVQALQTRHGSRTQYARMQAHGSASTLSERERAFLERADTLYLATVGETGWPYVQHRGGPRGFLRVLLPSQIAFADFRGNLQYVSAGNVAQDDRASIIVVDVVNRRRLKLLGHLRFVDVADAGAALVASVALPGYRATVERIAVFDVVAFDWNCPQHITQRFTAEEVEVLTQPLNARIATLEAELRRAGARVPVA
jgi:predicted pyridoxine 5'-phosphate oxidase superfamily flavin-nucleotide-binding protein